MFSITCQTGVVAGIIGSIHYSNVYKNVGNDSDSVQKALKHAGVLEPKVFDVAVIGGGIVGVATAREIRQKWPTKSVILLEKEADVARHQTGHPSGCIHAGMYYTPGSTMARLCPRGHDLIVEYCKRFGLPYKLCGKMIVGSEEGHEAVIEQLYQNGVANGVKGLKVLRSEKEIKAKEPAVHGTCALYSPGTGIVDFGAVTRHMRDQLVKHATGKFAIRSNFEVMDFLGVQLPRSSRVGDVVPSELVIIRGREPGQVGPEKRVVAKSVITCCGLGNDSIAKRTSQRGWWGPKVLQSYSFRGRYYQLREEKKNLVKMHIYPCPDLSKGLSVGIHVSPTVNLERGSHTILGPGSAFALHPYGYAPYHVEPCYLFRSVFSYGGWTSLVSNWRTLYDTYLVDFSKKAFLFEVQKLVPSVTMDDIEESFCGVTAMGVQSDGSLCSDLSLDYARPVQTFAAADVSNKSGVAFKPSQGAMMQDSTYPLIIHVRNAPSPAATASMAIAEEIVAASSLAFMWHK